MFTRQNSVRISLISLDLILPCNGAIHQAVGSFEFKEEPTVMGENRLEKRQEVQAAPNQSCFPMPKMEISLFNGLNLGWWVRRCERMFSLYNILDQ